MARVVFVGVGRNKKGWEVEIDNPTEKRLAMEVSMSGALMSRDIVCTQGQIFAGVRPVGLYTVDGEIPDSEEEPEEEEELEELDPEAEFPIDDTPALDPPWWESR